MTRTNVEQLHECGFGGVLVSYANDKKGHALDAVEGGPMHVMIDSGAFTAWTAGKQVDIDAFADYALTQRERFPDAKIVNLDIIPGTATAPIVSDKDRRAAIRQSAKNADALRNVGLPIMEVYHLDEPIKVLDAILERRRPGERVALGGLARQEGGRGFPVKHAFISAAFRHLQNRYGLDMLPAVHGLGIAPDGPIGGKAFPWASVDCSSWDSITRFGVKVEASGRRLGGRSDTRVKKSPGLANLYRSRVLDRWAELDDAHSRMWESRGIRVVDA